MDTAGFEIIADYDRQVRLVSKHVDAAMREEGYPEVTFDRAVIMRHIADGITSTKQLSLAISTTSNMISYAVKDLIDAGYVRRQTPDYDQRLSEFKLTWKGERALAVAMRRWPVT